MKKLFVLLLALVCIGGVFAEDAKPVFTVGMYGDVTATVTSDSGNNSYALYSETYFSYKAADWGFAATTVGGADFFATPRNYSFWYSFFDGMAKVYAGKLREAGGARLTSYIEAAGMSTRLAEKQEGVLASVFPVAGLTVSAFFPITSAGGKDLEAANFGAAYAIPDMATVVAGYSQKLKEMYVSADIKALKGMTLKLGFKNDGVASVNYVYATFGSTSLVEGLDLGLDADLVLGTTTAYGVELLGEYSISERVNVGAKLYYDNGDAWVANNAFVAKPFVKVLFGDSDVIVAFKYNATKSTWSIPIDFEISY